MKSLWQRIVDAIAELFGFSRGSNAFDNAMMCVDYILDNPSVYEYRQLAKKRRGVAREVGYDVFGHTKYTNAYGEEQVMFSIRGNVDSNDLSEYNDINITNSEYSRLESEAITWDSNKKGRMLNRTLSNGYTYKYYFDDEGVLHIVDKYIMKNIHERKNEYNADGNRKRFISSDERVKNRRRVGSGNILWSDNRRSDGRNDRISIDGASQRERVNRRQDKQSYRVNSTKVQSNSNVTEYSVSDEFDGVNHEKRQFTPAQKVARRILKTSDVADLESMYVDVAEKLEEIYSLVGDGKNASEQTKQLANEIFDNMVVSNKDNQELYTTLLQTVKGYGIGITDEMKSSFGDDYDNLVEEYGAGKGLVVCCALH